MENRFITCEYCPFFRFKYIDGCGICELTELSMFEKEKCYLLGEKRLCRPIALKVLEYFQKWRRGDNGKQPSGFLVGLALDEAIRSLRKEDKC